MGQSYPSDYDPEDKPQIADGLPPEFRDSEDAKERKRATEDEILARQELIGTFKTISPSITIDDLKKELHIKGYTVTRSTIYRDIQEIEDRAWQWSDRLAKSGFVFSCEQAAKRNGTLIATLNVALDEAREPRDKAIIARTINELQLTKINIEGRATYQRLKKARDKYMGAEELKTRFSQ